MTDVKDDPKTVGLRSNTIPEDNKCLSYLLTYRYSSLGIYIHSENFKYIYIVEVDRIQG